MLRVAIDDWSGVKVVTFSYVWISMTLMHALMTPTMLLLRTNPRVIALKERLVGMLSRGSNASN